MFKQNEVAMKSKWIHFFLDNPLHQASSIYSHIFPNLNQTVYKVKNKHAHNIESTLKCIFIPSALVRTQNNFSFDIKIVPPEEDNYLSLTFNSISSEETKLEELEEIKKHIYSNLHIKKDLTIFITLKGPADRYYVNDHIYVHDFNAKENNFNSKIINKECLLLEKDGVYITIHYFSYENVSFATADILKKMHDYYLCRWARSDNHKPYIEANDPTYKTAIEKTIYFTRELLKHLYNDDGKIFAPLVLPKKILQLSLSDIESINNESQYTKEQLIAIYHINKLTLNLLMFFDFKNNRTIECAFDLHDYLVGCLQKLCANPRFYMHKQSVNNTTKLKENDITSFLESLVSVNEMVITSSEAPINNGRVDLKVTYRYSQETFLIESKIIGQHLNRRGGFLKNDSECLRKAIIQIKQYLSNHLQWTGYILLYSFDIHQEKIINAIEKALPKIKNKMELEHLYLSEIKDNKLSTRMACYILTINDLNVRVIICELNTKTPTENHK